MRIGSVLKHSGQAVLEGALVATLVVGVVAGTAFAARGGGGKPGGSSPTATLYSSCNPCASGVIADLWGGGYDGSNSRGMVAVTSSEGWTAWAGVNMAPDGTTSFDWRMSPSGTYVFKVYQESHNKLTLKGQLSGVVVQ